MAYVGPEPNPGQNREVDDISSSFNGVTTAFTLQVNSQNVSPGSSNNIIVSLGGVVQNPGTDYTIAASTITFTTAPASGLLFFGLILGQGVDAVEPADGSITSAKLASGLSLTGDVSIADKIVHTGDTNTAIRFPAADTITAETGGSERFRIDSTGDAIIQDGDLVIGTAGHGIDFSAQTASSATGATTGAEILDHYEEGTWTPSGSWTTVTASYTKIGRMVYAGFSLRANTNDGSNVTIGDLPFVSGSTHGHVGGIIWGLCEVNTSDGWLQGSIGDSTSTVTVRKNNAVILTFGSGQNNLNQNAFIRGMVVYQTA